MISDNVRSLLIEKGVKFQSAAYHLGITPYTLSKKLSGTSSFKAEEIQKLSLLLNVPVSSFYDKDKQDAK